MQTPIIIVVPPSEHPITIRIDCSSSCLFKNQVVPIVSLQTCYDSYVSLRVLRPSTRKGYDRVILKYCIDWLERDLPSLTDDEILKKYVEIREKSGSAQAALAVRVLKALYAYAIARFQIPERNIGRILRVAGITLTPIRKTRHIQKNDLPKWYKAVSSQSKTRQERTARDIFLLGLFTGLRKTEIMSLKWEDIDLRSRILTARNTKNHRDHSLPLPDFLVRLLRERKPDTGKSPYVFPGKDLTVRIRDIDDSRFRVIDESGINFTIHDLRRTFATIAAEMGIPPYLLKKLLNHKSGDVTEGYVISTVEILRNPVQKIAKRIEDLCRMKREEVVQEESA
ncbi:MAG: tyrosine-type recombinase/integrase [Leptospirillum sp.]|jgi:integrase